MCKKKESPGAATSGEVTVPIEEYGHGSYKLRDLVEQLVAADPRLKSVNLALEQL